MLLDDYQVIIQRLKKHKVRKLLRQKARYLKNKIAPDTKRASELKVALENGDLHPSSFEHIPALTMYTLILWIFEASQQSRGYGFPFDRSHLEFYRRLETVNGLLQDISNIHLRNKAKDNRPFIQTNKLLKEIMADKELNNAVADMSEKAEVFDKLREALRIAIPEGEEGLNDDGLETDIKTIEARVSKFKDWLRDDASRKTTYRKMIEQIDKYWEKLFADPLIVDTSDGQVMIAPQRTNNMLERFFRGEKRRARKKSGTASLNKTLKTILADTPLVRNLENEEYQQIILNGCSSLAERFSQIDAKLVQDHLKEAEKNQEKILPEVKKLIRQTDLPEKISALFHNFSNFNANCHFLS